MLFKPKVFKLNSLFCYFVIPTFLHSFSSTDGKKCTCSFTLFLEVWLHFNCPVINTVVLSKKILQLKDAFLKCGQNWQSMVMKKIFKIHLYIHKSCYFLPLKHSMGPLFGHCTLYGFLEFLKDALCQI